MLRPLPVAAAAALLLVSPAFADAVSYRGTIGDREVVVEFAAPLDTPGGVPFGRYFYPEDGVDIPLLTLGADSGFVFLHQTLPCTPECVTNDDGTAYWPDTGGAWQLESPDGGATVTGFWGGTNDETFDVKLERVGTRPFEIAPDGTPEALARFSIDALWMGTPIAAETSPYDFIKMSEAELAVAEATIFGDGSSFTTVIDPRTKFAYPRIAMLADESPGGAANAYLEQRHWALNADALACVARQYPGMGWNGYIADSVGTLGGWEDETVTVQYLSPKVMSWTESGSIFCGGAHPYNHDEAFNLDIRSGTLLDLTSIFSVWIAKDYNGDPVDPDMARANPADYTWGASEELVQFVLANRLPDADAEYEADCGSEELIRSNLAIGFKDGERVVFRLGGLPHVISVCSGELLDVTLSDLPEEFLTPEARDYFPSLAD